MRENLLKNENDQIVFDYKDQRYQLTSHPYEPCTYVSKNGILICVLHNGFNVYDLPDIFASGETVMAIDGKEYDQKGFMKVLYAAIESGRTEMDFPFAAKLVKEETDID